MELKMTTVRSKTIAKEKISSFLSFKFYVMTLLFWKIKLKFTSTNGFL